MEYVERKLGEAGARGKVIPPDDELAKLAERMYRAKHSDYVEDAIQQVVSSGVIEEELADEFLEKFGLEHVWRYIEEAFKEDETLPGRDALEKRLDGIQEEHAEDLLDAVRRRITEALDSSDYGEDRP